MPQRNTIKEYVSDSYYHIYFRGVNKSKLFFEAPDYHYFLSLFDRYLSKRQTKSKTGVLYQKYNKEIQLEAYCLMNNHVHMFIYQGHNEQALSKFMSSIMTSYGKYLNIKYRRVGSVFESRYKAKRIDDDSYFIHISRYIHMNPRYWQTYRNSSLRYVYAEPCPE